MFVTCGVLLAGCLETTSFPDEPEITFQDFVQYPDSAIVTIGFTDGDGNFGLDQADTTGSYCTNGCLFYWNFFCEYYEKVDGEWVHQAIDWTDPDELPFYYRVPRVIPSGQNPSLEGEIEVAKADLRIFLANPIGVAEHIDYVITAEKKLEALAHAEDKLESLNRL